MTHGRSGGRSREPGMMLPRDEAHATPDRSVRNAFRSAGATVKGVVLRFLYPQQRVRPTSLGIYFTILSLIVGLAAVNTGNNVLFLVFSLMLSALLVSGVTSRAAMRRIVVKRKQPESIYAGISFNETVTVSNLKRLYPTVSLRLKTQSSTENVFLPYLRPRGSRTVFMESRYGKRGRQRVPPLECKSHYPFGLFERRRTESSDGSVVVYPHIERIVPFFPEREGGHGERAAVLKGEGEDLYQIREYTPSDSARSIDWKASSRVAKLMAKDHHRNVHLQVTLIVDPSSGEESDAEAVEKQISLAASMAEYLHQNHVNVQLVSPDGTIPPGCGPSHLRECLTHLALLRLCTMDEGISFRKSISPSLTRGSIPVFFTARGSTPDFPIKAYRVLPTNRAAAG